METKNASVIQKAVRSHQTTGTQNPAPIDPHLALPERFVLIRQVHHTRQLTHEPTTLLLALHEPTTLLLTLHNTQHGTLQAELVEEEQAHTSP